MKATSIRFFSPDENNEPKEKGITKTVTATGYISSTGKLVFPTKTVAQLGFDPDTTRFRIGTQEGKRKLKSLFLIPANGGQAETFVMEKAAKSYGISLASILQKNKIEFATSKYTFTIKPFDYEADVTGYELQLDDQTPKPEYSGKPRGRKPKGTDA